MDSGKKQIIVRVLKYVYLGVMLIFYGPFMDLGMIIYAMKTAYRGHDLSYMDYMPAILFGMCTLITIGSLFRVHKRKWVILPGVGMKFWVFFLLIGIDGFFDGPLGMGISFTLICVFFWVVFFLADWEIRHGKVRNQERQERILNEIRTRYTYGMKYKQFAEENAFAFRNLVTREYMEIHRLNSSEELADQKKEIEDYCCLYLAYFLEWLIRKNLYRGSLSESRITAMKNCKVTPVELMKEAGGRLKLEDVDPVLSIFMNNYFLKTYFDDYYLETGGNTGIIFCHEYSEDTYERIALRIEGAYEGYCMGRRGSGYTYEDARCNDDPVHIAGLDKDVSILFPDSVPKDYLNRCVEHLRNLPDSLKNEMEEAFERYARAGEQGKSGSVMNRLGFGRMLNMPPCSEEPAYVLWFDFVSVEDGRSFSRDFGEDGMSFVIRGGYLMEAGPWSPARTPWSAENREMYEARIQLERGETERIRIPVGGIDENGNPASTRAMVPRSVAQKIRENEILLPMWKKIDVADEITYYVHTSGEEVVPEYIWAEVKHKGTNVKTMTYKIKEGRGK